MPSTGRIEKETEGVALVSRRHSAPQFPLHPYTIRRKALRGHTPD